MGNFGSKIFPMHGDQDGKPDVPSQIGLGNLEKHQCTPIMSKKRLMNDPRSASSGITRTPIEVSSSSAGVNRIASAVPKRLQVKKYLETDVDSVMSTIVSDDPRSPTNCCQRTPIVLKTSNNEQNLKLNIGTPQTSMNNWDPRSPATDFDRTPILKAKSERLDDKNEASPTPQMYCELSNNFNIPEIQVLPEIENSKSVASNLEKRLEECINFDDNVDFASNTASNTDESDFDDQITVIPNVKAFQKETDELSEETNNLQIQETLLQNNTNQISIWRDSLSQLTDFQVLESLKKNEEIIIEFDDEQSIAKASELKMDKSKAKKKMQQVKRDSKLIYEDSTEVNANNLNHEALINRIPLANKSNRHQLKLPINSSQIARTKAIALSKENTPPRSKRAQSKSKANSTQWDHDRTVVI